MWFEWNIFISFVSWYGTRLLTNFWYNATLQEGNYWSDYTGVDADSNGIGDTPYDILGGSNQDLYPFMYESGWINQPPFIPSIPSGPTTGFRNTEYQYNTSTIEPNGDNMFFLWDWDDGTEPVWYGPYSSDEICSITHEWSDIGTYDVSVKAKDQTNLESDWSESLEVSIINKQPVANFSYNPLNPTDLETIQFTDLSYDSDGTIMNWTWDFDDGDISYLQNPTHQYADDGTYLVNLTVMDDDYEYDSLNRLITVTNVPPVADANGPYAKTIGDSVHFDGSGSYDPDGTIVSYDWNFGDGHIGTGVKPSHRYDTHGTYNVTLTVTDDDGFTDTDTTYVVINKGNPPSVQLIYPTGGEILKDTVTIEWYAHDSKDGNNLPIHLFYSDGETWVRINDVLENTGEYEWYTTELPDGTYELLIEAIDNEGNIGHDSSESFEIDNYHEPDNHPPAKPEITGPNSGKAGEEYDYTFSSVDPDGDAVQIYIEWGDGDSEWTGFNSSGDVFTRSHIWDEKDTYIIRAKAKDSNGAESDWATLEISMPKNKAINPFILFLERLTERFPILEQILQPVYDKLTGF